LIRKKVIKKNTVISMLATTIHILPSIFVFSLSPISAFAQTTPIPNVTYITTSNSITLFWISIPGTDEYGYSVGLYGSEIAHDTLTGTTVTISNLSPNTTYFVQVSAYSESWGGWGANNNLNITTQNSTSNAATPEFGPLAALVLSISLIFIIVVSTKKKQEFQ
jgi:hypothetical protein